MAIKYRQRGYKDNEFDDDRTKRKPARNKPLTPEEKAHRRGLRHSMDREAKEVVRCPTCGRNVRSFGAITSETTCPGCNAALRCCRACIHFDSGARWECRSQIEARIPDKNKVNDCQQYEPRLVLDSTGKRTGTAVSGDPKSAFDSLFKK